MKNILIKLINNRGFNFIAYISISLVAPVVIILYRYDVFERETPWYIRIGVPSFVTLVWFTLKFWSTIYEEIRTMKEGFMRELLLSIMHLGPYILLFGLGIFLEIFYKDYMFITTTLLVTQTLGVVLNARHNYLKRKELIDRGYVNVLK